MEQETVVGTIKQEASRANEICRSQLASSAPAFTGVSSGRGCSSLPRRNYCRGRGLQKGFSLSESGSTRRNLVMRVDGSSG